MSGVATIWATCVLFTITWLIITFGPIGKDRR